MAKCVVAASNRWLDRQTGKTGKMKMRKQCAEYGGKWGVWDKPTMLKLLNEV
jgi:hypothetical protein